MRIWIHNFYHTHPQKFWLLSSIHSLLVVAFVFFFLAVVVLFHFYLSVFFSSHFFLSSFLLLHWITVDGSKFMWTHTENRNCELYEMRMLNYDFTFASHIETLNSLSPMHSLVIYVCLLSIDVCIRKIEHLRSNASTNFDLFKFAFFKV